MIKAVVFDMDGVIFDSERLYRKHWKISGLEIGISEEEMEEVCNMLAGATKEVNSVRMKERYGEDFDYMAFRKITMDRMDEDIRQNGIDIKAGVVELLKYLKEKNIKIGLATSTDKTRAEGNLRNAGLYGYFDNLVFGQDVEKGKPSPDIYIRACENLGVMPEETIGLEDSINGVKSSYAAGLYTIMVVDLIQPTEEIKNNYSHKIFDSMYQVLDMLNS